MVDSFSMASADVRGTVLLLKAPRETGDDPFVETLKEAGYRVILVPVLSFRFVNQEALTSALIGGGGTCADRYSGVVFTSVRAVQSVTRVLNESRDAEKNEIQFDPSQLRCFVVGQTTAKAAKEAGFEPEGADAGNAETLAGFIVDALDKGEKRPLLYPCAQIRRDTLLDRLRSSDCIVEEVTAYETIPSENIRQDIISAFANEESSAEVWKSRTYSDPPDTVVYFSPSGVQFTEGLVEEGVLPLQSLKVYALGPTTEQALVSRHFPVLGVASKPDAPSLLQLLQQKR